MSRHPSTSRRPIAALASIAMYVALAAYATSYIGALAIPVAVIAGAMHATNVYLGGSLLDPAWEVFGKF